MTQPKPQTPAGRALLDAYFGHGSPGWPSKTRWRTCGRAAWCRGRMSLGIVSGREDGVNSATNGYGESMGEPGQFPEVDAANAWLNRAASQDRETP